MPAPQRWALALALAIIAVAAIGVGVHKSPTRHPPRSSTPPSRPSATSTAVGSSVFVSSTTSTVPSGPPGPSSSTMAEGLLDPTDFGGYYTVEPSVGTALVDSAPCLAAVGPSPAQSGRALTALVGPDLTGLPEMVEVVTSYPGSEASAVFHAVNATLAACQVFDVNIGGTSLKIPLSEESPQALQSLAIGNAAVGFQGSFSVGGLAQTLQVGVVLDGQMVITVVWIENVSLESGEAIMGNFPTTVDAAFGKLA